jgi:malonyl-CoA O-methyltransferase
MIVPMINKDIQMAFNKAAHTYAEAAFLYRATGERLLARLDYMLCKPGVILDAGCGLGNFSNQLAERYPQAQIVSIDFAEKMIALGKSNLISNIDIHAQPLSFQQDAREADEATEDSIGKRINWVVGNMTQLPLLPESVDMIFANQSIQDIEDVTELFRDFHRILKPGGVLLFSTLGPDTLKELKAAWACVDTYGHIREWKDLHVLGDALLTQRFMQPVVDREEMVVHYKDPARLLQDLKEQGSYNVHPIRRKGLMGVDARDYLFYHLEQQKKDGKIAMTYEVVYGHAWRGESRSEFNAKTGETVITLDKLRRKSF